MDAGLEGSTGKPFDLVVEPGKVREFARAVGAGDPGYLDAENPVSPPTFLVTQEFWRGPENQPPAAAAVDFARLLHGEQEFVFHGPPPCAGARLTAVTRIEKVYQKHGKRGGVMTFMDWLTEFRDERGELVAESRATLLQTSRPVVA